MKQVWGKQETNVNRLAPKCHCVGAPRVSFSLTSWEDVPCSRGAWQCSESLDSPLQASANSPARQGVKVPFLRVERLVFHPSQSKANGQHGESEDEEACDPKHSSPGVKPAHRGRKGVSALRAPPPRNLHPLLQKQPRVGIKQDPGEISRISNT